MIAVILAAGRGSRLQEYTEDKPKSLLPLSSTQTILDYNLEILNLINVEKILIVTGYRSEKIEEHITSFTNVHHIYNAFWDKCNVLGSLFMALPHIDDDFLFLHADTLVGKEAWKEMIKINADIVLPYQEKACGEEEMKVKISEEGKLLEINKIMNPDEAQGEFLGIAKFNYLMVEEFKVISESLFKKGDLNHYMEAVITEILRKEKKVQIDTLNIGNADFVEIDFEEDYIKAKETFS